MRGKSQVHSGESDFDLVMRRHGIEVMPNARELALSIFEDLTRAARLVRRERSMVTKAAYIFSPEAVLRTVAEPQ